MAPLIIREAIEEHSLVSHAQPIPQDNPGFPINACFTEPPNSKIRLAGLTRYFI
jgi:hypothetical protein